MNRFILKALNAPILILLTAIGVGLQTTLFQPDFLRFFQPDIVLICVIWCALRRNFTEGGLITLIVADLAEVHSAVPRGLFLVTYMAVYLLVRSSSRILVISSRSSWIGLTLIVSVAWKLMGLGLLYLLGLSANQWKHTLLFLIPGALAEGLAAFGLFHLLERFDLITFKNVRAERVLDDELQINYDEI